MSESSSLENVDYGPLSALIGAWRGDKGLDIAPEPDGDEENPYYETITYEAAGEVINAESQTLAAVFYRQVVRRKSNDRVFHDQTGYWMWDAADGAVMQSLTSPRAVCALAGGRYTGSAGPGDQGNVEVQLEVQARQDDPDWGIIQSPFMRDRARTLEFRHQLSVGAAKLSYAQTTVVEIYGRTFEHTDRNELVRC